MKKSAKEIRSKNRRAMIRESRGRRWFPWRALVLVIGLGLAWCAATPALQAEERVDDVRYANAVIIELEGVIDRQLLTFFERKLSAAKSHGATLVIIEIESPGGGLEESLLIAEALRDVDWATTVSFVPEKALSGAALISLGCDKIMMAETARIGDAGVVFLDETFMFRYAPEKIMSDLVLRARELAKANGYPPELAEAMIDRTAVVYRSTAPGGESDFRIEYFVPPDEDANAPVPDKELDDGKWVMVEGTEPTRFLVVSGERAHSLGLASATVSGRDSLKSELGYDGEFRIMRSGFVDGVVYWLNRPWITGLLFVVGLFALYMELSAPGISVGGLIASLCFGLFFWSRFLGGTAVWLELLLFVLGVVFILMEIFVIPGTGLSGILGVLLVIVSLIMASQSFVMPRTTVELGEVGRSFAVVLGSGIAFIFVVTVLARYIGFVPVANRMILIPPDAAAESEREKASIAGGKKGALSIQIGDFGIADSVLRPAGKARFGRQMIDVTANGDFVDAGAAVKVIQINGNRIVVEAADGDDV